MTERCVAHTIQIEGSWNNKKHCPNVYTVSKKDGFPTCTCTSFAINRNRAVSMRTDIKPPGPNTPHIKWCKHIDAVWEKICGWQGDPLCEGMCDECYGPTEVISE